MRYVHADSALRKPGSFLNLLVGSALDVNVEVVNDPKASVDLQFTSVQVKPIERARRDAVRGLARLVPALQRGRDPRWESENPEPVGRAAAHVWFTGENVRPPTGAWDGYLSFDLDPFGGRNVYCPIWWWSLDLMGPAVSTFMSPAPTIEVLRSPRASDLSRPGFAAAFINNPHPMRMHAVEALARVGQVDLFGRAVGRPVPNKADVARNYRFVLCFENDFYPGYVTEKPIEAWACGAIPLWWGSDPGAYLNSEAVVNAADFPSLTDMADEVARLDADPTSLLEVASRPLVVKEPLLDPAKDLVRRLVSA